MSVVTATQPITRAEVEAAEQAWADGILAIGRLFTAGGDYKSRAVEHIRTLYAYDHEGVVFKPTLASQTQFRHSFDDALSYFVKGHLPEDAGFAIRPWDHVRFGEQTIKLFGDTAMAMGNYYLTEAGQSEEIKVEFSLVYRRDPAGRLRIVLHHSSLPYTPE